MYLLVHSSERWRHVHTGTLFSVLRAVLSTDVTRERGQRARGPRACRPRCAGRAAARTARPEAGGSALDRGRAADLRAGLRIRMT